MRFEQAGSGSGKLAVVAIGVVILVLLAAVALRSKPAAQTGEATPSPSAAEPAESRPKLLTLPQSRQVLADLAAEGRFALAIELIETCDPALRELGKDEFPAKLEQFQRGQAVHESFEAALAEGAESRRLFELILQSENYELDPDLQSLGFVQLFQAKARVLLGEQAYEDLVLYGMPKEPAADDDADDDDDDEIELLRPQARDIQTRGSEERRQRFAAAAKQAAQRVEEARARSSQRQAETSKRIQAEAARALADERPVEVPAWRGEAAWSGRLVSFKENAFSLQGPEGRRRFTWIDAPPATACDVLERGVAEEDAEGTYRLARRALVGGLFDRAEWYLRRLKILEPDRPQPDQAALRNPFDDPNEIQDWIEVGPAQLQQRSGELRLAPFTQLGLTYARAVNVGQFQAVTCTVSPAYVSSRVVVGFGDHYVRCGRDGASLQFWGAEEEVEPDEGTPVDLTRPFVVSLRPRDGVLEVQVRQGPQLLLDTTAPSGREGFYLVLGAQGGEIRLKKVRLSGEPVPQWYRRSVDALPFSLERALEEWEVRYGPHASAMIDVLPPSLAKTSAEDEVGLEGVPAAAQAEVKAARRWLERRDYGTAARYLRQAISQGRGGYWAAEYLLALCELEEAAHGDNLEGERIRLERALQGIEDFYEALTTRSTLHLQEGNLAAARADAKRALELRPDYAPAHLALAWVRVQEGDMAGASAAATLASELSGDLETRRESARIQALREGPSWNEPQRFESDHYVVWTDLPGRGEGFLRELEELRDLAPRVLPTLQAREGAIRRKGEVFVFARPEDFYRYAYRTLGDRGERLAGVFSPRSGKLLLFESREGPEQTSLVLRHEATHQWVHSLGLALPYWVNEAIATYLAGVREKHRGGFETKDWDEQEITVLLHEEANWLPLFELMTMSPAQFYSGYTYLNYAQAWSFVHYCMEGGDPALRTAFLVYLDRHSRGRAGDKSGLLGVKLEHIYADTFHQLDMNAVEQRWRQHVKGPLAQVLRNR
jgi:hypothetical protein